MVVGRLVTRGRLHEIVYEPPNNFGQHMTRCGARGFMQIVNVEANAIDVTCRLCRRTRMSMSVLPKFFTPPHVLPVPQAILDKYARDRDDIWFFTHARVGGAHYAVTPTRVENRPVGGHSFYLDTPYTVYLVRGGSRGNHDQLART